MFKQQEGPRERRLASENWSRSVRFKYRNNTIMHNMQRQLVQVSLRHVEKESAVKASPPLLPRCVCYCVQDVEPSRKKEVLIASL